MYYYVVEIATMKDGTTPSAITRKDSEREALMLYHQIMSSAMANENIVKIACVILDESGSKMDIDPGVYDGE